MRQPKSERELWSGGGTIYGERRPLTWAEHLRFPVRWAVFRAGAVALGAALVSVLLHHDLRYAMPIALLSAILTSLAVLLPYDPMLITRVESEHLSVRILVANAGDRNNLFEALVRALLQGSILRIPIAHIEESKTNDSGIEVVAKGRTRQIPSAFPDDLRAAIRTKQQRLAGTSVE